MPERMGGHSPFTHNLIPIHYGGTSEVYRLRRNRQYVVRGYEINTRGYSRNEAIEGNKLLHELAHKYRIPTLRSDFVIGSYPDVKDLPYIYQVVEPIKGKPLNVYLSSKTEFPHPIQKLITDHMERLTYYFVDKFHNEGNYLADIFTFDQYSFNPKNQTQHPITLTDVEPFHSDFLFKRNDGEDAVTSANLFLSNIALLIGNLNKYQHILIPHSANIIYNQLKHLMRQLPGHVANIDPDEYESTLTSLDEYEERHKPTAALLAG